MLIFWQFSEVFAATENLADTSNGLPAISKSQSSPFSDSESLIYERSKDSISVLRHTESNLQNDSNKKNLPENSNQIKKKNQESSSKIIQEKLENKNAHQEFKASSFKINSNHRVISEINITDNIKALNRQDRFIDSQFGYRLYSSFYFKKNFELYSFARLTRLDNSAKISQRRVSIDGGGNRNFENLGIYLPELNLRYRHKNNLLVLGKFTPDFGNGWRFDRGIWIQNIPSQYKQNEKLGIAAVHSVGDAKKTGLYDLAISFFKNDRSFLYDSVFAKRDSFNPDAAMPGDTSSLNSFNLSTNLSFDFGPDEKLVYHISYLDLASNKSTKAVPANKIQHQKGAAYGISYKLPLGDKVKLYNIIEFVEMKSVGGNSDVESGYLTASIGAKFFNRWTIVAGKANRKTKNATDSIYEEDIRELSFGYDCPKTEFFDRFTAQIGYQKSRYDHKSYADNRQGIGILVRYYKNF